MSNYHKKTIKYCEHDAPCVLEYDDGDLKPANSLTHLGLLSGAPDTDANSQSLYGSEFKGVDYKTPYYELMVHEKVSPPWLARQCEGGFLNRLKTLDEPVVTSYRELMMAPIPDSNNYGMLEGFNHNKKKCNCNINMFLVFILVICIIFFIVMTCCA